MPVKIKPSSTPATRPGTRKSPAAKASASSKATPKAARESDDFATTRRQRTSTTGPASTPTRAGTLGWEPVTKKEVKATDVVLRTEQEVKLPRGQWLDLEQMLLESSSSDEYPPKKELAELFTMLKKGKVKFHLAVDRGVSSVALLPDVVVAKVAPHGYDKDFQVTFAGADQPIRSLSVDSPSSGKTESFIKNKALSTLAKADPIDFIGGDVGEFQLGPRSPNAHWSPHNQFFIFIP